VFKIEQLLFKGFVTRKICINNNIIIFKSLNQKEIEEIEENCSKDRKSIVYNIIYSIYKINSINVLPFRNEYINELYDDVSKWNLYVIDKVISVINSISDYVNGKAYEDFKKYLDTETSKEKFLIFEKSKESLNDTRLTSINGTEYLGFNVFQEAWIKLNSIIKSNEDFKERWELVKFICTLINPRAMKKVDLDEKVEPGVQTIGSANFCSDFSTREGLVKEMYRQIRGEKDIHDVIVEKYEKAVVDEINKKTDIEKIKSEEKAKTLDLEKGEITSESRIVDVHELNEMVHKRSERLNNAKIEMKNKDKNVVNKELKEFKEKRKNAKN
jgi:hypothetical protein